LLLLLILHSPFHVRERGTAATAVDFLSKDKKAEPAAVVRQKIATFPGFESQRSLTFHFNIQKYDNNLSRNPNE